MRRNPGVGSERNLSACLVSVEEYFKEFLAG